MSRNALALSRDFNFPSIHKYAIGFDSIFDELTKAGTQRDNYPPYNIISIDENKFSIEMAVAGFKEDEISLTTEKNVLTVRGSQTAREPYKEVKSDDSFVEVVEPKYLYQGISSRDFVRNFNLAEHVEVVDAIVENGILTINLELIIPEDLKPKTIPITFKKN